MALFEKIFQRNGMQDDITFSFKQSISIVLSDISENPSSLFITIQRDSKGTQKMTILNN